mmetsp:Transcript_34363/g.91249  ORF Transcript_34363/g.91249 Transcript_34363/m.91249 type:complete len:600 (+) Transcript_34363:1363-3162(+)
MASAGRGHEPRNAVFARAALVSIASLDIAIRIRIAIPVNRQVARRELELQVFGGSRRQFPCLLEGPKNPLGFPCVCREGQVHLCHLCPRHRAGVGDAHRHRHDTALEHRPLDPGVRKGRVAEAMPEWICNVLGDEATPPGEQPVTQVTRRICADRGGVGLLQREGHRQAGGWVQVAVEDISDGIARLLPGEKLAQDRVYVAHPLRGQDRAGAHRHHDQRDLGLRSITRGEGDQEIVLVQQEARPVFVLAGSHTPAGDRHVHNLISQHIHRLVNAVRRGLPHVALAAVREALDDRGRRIREYAARAAYDVVVALVPLEAVSVRFLLLEASRAQECDALLLAQRQHTVVVLQQHHGCRCHLAGELCVGGTRGVVPDVLLATGLAQARHAHGAVEGRGLDHAAEHAAGHVGDVCLTGGVQILHRPWRGVAAWVIARHHQVQATGGGLCLVVNGPPVRHHEALEAHFLLEVAHEQRVILARLLAIDAVVRAHHTRDVHLVGCDERWVMDLPHITFVCDVVLGVAVRLLRVHHEVLGHASDALTLHAHDVLLRHYGREVGIFSRNALGVPAALLHSGDVHARPQDLIGALSLELSTDVGGVLEH